MDCRIFHRGMLVVSHVARHQAGARIDNRQPVNAMARLPQRAGDTTAMVTRLVDGGGVQLRRRRLQGW